MNPIGKDISAWSEILSVNPSLVEWTRTEPLSLSQDIIRTDKVTYPSLASGHNTRNTASIYSEIDKLKDHRRGGYFIKIQEGAQEVSFMDVWSVGGDLMSDWLDLSGHQHPNCYLGPGQMTGLVPYLRK